MEYGGCRPADDAAATTSIGGALRFAQAAVLDNIQHRYNENYSCPLTPWENR